MGGAASAPAPGSGRESVPRARGDGGILQRARQTQAGLVQSCKRVVGNQRIGVASQRQVVFTSARPSGGAPGINRQARA
jgi:hypothetical protein